jgi:hypothetical protein
MNAIAFESIAAWKKAEQNKNKKKNTRIIRFKVSNQFVMEWRVTNSVVISLLLPHRIDYPTDYKIIFVVPSYTHNFILFYVLLVLFNV